MNTVAEHIPIQTALRPQLTDSEAASYTMAHYFSESGMVENPSKQDPWIPEKWNIEKDKPDFIVGPQKGMNGATHTTIQQAVNDGYVRRKTKSVCIQILPGIYNGAVYVPIDYPPLTIIGGGESPSDVNIQLALDATMTAQEYQSIVNPAGQFYENDPAWYMYKSVIMQSSATIETPASPVVWVQSDRFRIAHVTITNTLLDTVDGSTHQAVALRTDGDRTRIENCRIIGRQDTLWVNAGDRATHDNKLGAYSTTRITRAYIKDTYVEGDNDFVMGRANAVFENCTFRLVTSRRPASITIGEVFAPDTLPRNKYGFLAVRCTFMSDEGYASAKVPLKATLGRSWDQGTRATGYIMGKSPNGQLVIRESIIDHHFNEMAPWHPFATTSHRPFEANLASDRDLNDPKFNRLWEYRNTWTKTMQ